MENSENMGANLEKMEPGGLGIWQWTLSQRVLNFMCVQNISIMSGEKNQSYRCPNTLDPMCWPR